MAEKNLGNAAFFAIKGLKKDIEEIRKRLEIAEEQIRETSLRRPQEE